MLFCWCLGPLHCTHAYASAYATPPRLQGVPTRARLSLVAPTRTPTQENRAPIFSSSSFAMPSQSLSDTDAEKQMMWKMIAPPKRDNMFDFPGIPFVVALNQQCFFWWFGAYTLLARLREGLRKPTRPARGAYAITSQLPGAYLRGQPLSSSVEVRCGSSSWKIATFQCKCSFGSSCTTENQTSLADRKGLRTQNALKAYANAYAGPTRSLREDCRTNRRKAKEENSFIRGKQSNDLLNKRQREKPTRGVTQQPTR